MKGGVGWWIALGIAALIAGLLLLPIHLRLTYRESFSVSARILFIRLRLFPKKEAKPGEKAKKKKPKSPKKTKKKKEKPQKKPPRTLTEKITDAGDLMRRVTELIRLTVERVSHHLTVTLYRMHVRAAAGEPDKTAVAYGAAAQGMAYLLEYLSQKTTLRVKKNAVVRVEPDFLGTSFSADLDLDARLRVWQILDTAFRVLFRYLKQNGARQKNSKTIT